VRTADIWPALDSVLGIPRKCLFPVGLDPACRWDRESPLCCHGSKLASATTRPTKTIATAMAMPAAPR